MVVDVVEDADVSGTVISSRPPLTAQNATQTMAMITRIFITVLVDRVGWPL